MHETALNHLRQLDRADLAVFLTAVNGAKNALKRDECGDWIIIGTRGTIRACNGAFSVFVAGRSRRHWFFVKKALAGFCSITQDGDDEGVLRLTRLPAGEEIVQISTPSSPNTGSCSIRTCRACYTVAPRKTSSST
jgi:hypothetical protein